MVSNPNEDLGLIYTKQGNKEAEQEGRPIIDDTTVVTIKKWKAISNLALQQHQCTICATNLPI